MVFALPAPDLTQAYPPYGVVPQQTVVRLTFEGANPNPMIEGVQPLPGQVSFFLGNNSDRWQSNLTAYGAVVYRDLYPGIDLVYRGNEGRLKSEFVVSPGADPALIRLRYHEVDRVELAEDGALILHTPTGQLVEAPLLVYQEIEGVRHEVEGHYRLVPGEGQRSDPIITIQLAAYDPAYELIIDPELVYSSYLGGGDYDRINSIVLDSAGNIWLAGQTYSTNFPLKNAIQDDFGGGFRDGFVTQLIKASGSYTYGYSSYLGGSGTDEVMALVVDKAGRVYLSGNTSSSNFPITPNAIQSSLGGSDAFVTQIISAAGVYTYAFSTYLGGSSSEAGRAITIDDKGQIYVAGGTNSSNFPTTPNAPQKTHNGGFTDVFVTQIISAAGVYTYGFSSYLGGSGNDSGSSVAIDNKGQINLTGLTGSINFPITPNAPQKTYGGDGDAFVTQIISAAGVYTYSFSSYLGGGDEDTGRAIKINSAGNIYVAGETHSTNFSTTPNAIQDSYEGGLLNGFVTQIISAAGVYTYGYSSYVGSYITSGLTLALDSLDRMYVVGAIEAPTLPTTPDAIQGSFGGGDSDVFIMQIISTTGIYTYGYSSYLGGSDYDYSGDIVVDDIGRIYIGGQTGSLDFPITDGANQNDHNGASDGFITVIDLDQVNLELRKQVDDATPTPGQRLTYTLILKNEDTVSATNVTLLDFLPTGLSFAGPVTLEGASGNVAQDAGDLPTLASGLTLGPAAVVTVTFPVTVNVANTTVTNTASVTAAETTIPQTASVSITVGSETQPPTIPTLITPTGGITLALARPNFDWTDATDNEGVISYTLILTRAGNRSTFTSTVSSFTPPAD